MTLSSDELEPSGFGLGPGAVGTRGGAGLRVEGDQAELARRWVAKGYDPRTGRPLH
ncbi:hypothetical protein [Methanothrix soehngenii]|uniref:hypothetical protein n=1 Tax=Methanothrix soehngenii TaxID=2223 RepID=UPI00300C67F1